MLRQVHTLGCNTFTEALRQPVYAVIVGTGISLLMLNPALSAYTFGEDDKMLLDLGLSTLFLAGIFLCAFTAAGVVTREIENRTALTILSKPVSRPAFLIGKYLGVAAALALAVAIWALVFLMTVRHQVMSTARDSLDGPVWTFGLLALALAVGGAALRNWVAGVPFTNRLIWLLAIGATLAYGLVLLIDRDWGLQSLGTEFQKNDGALVQVIAAIGLILEALLILCALAVALSTRFRQATTLVLCLACFLLGLSSEWILARIGSDGPLGQVGAALLPNFQYHWLADALTDGRPVDGAYLGEVSLYTAVYVAAILSIATALFGTREVASTAS